MIKLAVVFLLCLIAYLWVQRKHIATVVIQRQLATLEISDLDFSVAELSFSEFGLSEVCWGKSGNPFFYVSSVKAHYSLKGLLSGRIDEISLGRVETSVVIDENNKPKSEFVERSLLVGDRIKQKYPAKSGRGEKTAFVIPDLKVRRGSLTVYRYGGAEMGQIDLNADIRKAAGGIEMSGYVDAPDGKSAAFKARGELTSLNGISSLAAKITASVDFSGLSDPAFAFAPQVVDLTGVFSVHGMDKAPEWELKLAVPVQVYHSGNELYDLYAELQGKSEIKGALTNMSASCNIKLNTRFNVKAADGRPAVTNGADISLGFVLPATALDRLASAQISGECNIGRIYSQSEDLLDIADAAAMMNFTVSAEHGLQSSGPSISLPHINVMGIDAYPGNVDVSVSNRVVYVHTSATVADEPLKVVFDLAVPIENQQGGSLKIKVPPFRINESGRIGALLREKTGEKGEFNGLLSAQIDVNGFGPAGVVSGMVDFADGSYSSEKLNVAGVEMQLPFELVKGKPESTGNSVLRIGSVDAGNLHMTDGKVLFNLKSDELFIESGDIGWAKGYLRAYAIHAGFDGGIRNEFTIYADKVDLGEVFTLVMPFEGRMEGVLYGRFPVRLKGKKVKLTTGYLYSLPGQGGVLKLENPVDMEGLLEKAGISRKLKKPLSHALSDLEFSAIRFDLEKGGRDDSVLRIKLDGESKYKEWPAPVDLNINLHGPLETILNLGIELKGLGS